MLDSKTLGFLTTLGASGAIGAAVLALFCALRARVPGVYQLRGESAAGWVRSTWRVSEDDVVKRAGTDAAMYLRHLRSCAGVMALAAAFGAVVLMPVFGTAGLGSDGGGGSVEEGLDLLSLANVPRSDAFVGSLRLYAAVAVQVVSATLFFWALQRDFRVYAHRLEAYLRAETPANYAVVVRRIAGDSNDDATAVVVESVQRAVEGARVSDVVLVNHCDGKKKKCDAVVVCENRGTAAAVVKAGVCDSEGRQMPCERAPEPEAVRWRVFRISPACAVFRRLLGLFFVVLFMLAIMIPTMLVVGFYSLSDMPSFREGDVPVSPFVAGLAENVGAALLILGLSLCVPTIFRSIVRKEKLYNRCAVDRRARNYFCFAYMLFFIIVITVVTSIMATFPIKIGRSDETRMVHIRVPSTGVLIASYIVMQTLVVLPLQLLQPVRLLQRWSALRAAKTADELVRAEACRSTQQLFHPYTQAHIVTFLGMTFAPISPIVAVCAAGYLGFAYFVHKYNLLFTTSKSWEAGGEMFPGVFAVSVFGFVLREFFLANLYGAKTQPLALAALLSLAYMVLRAVFGCAIGARLRWKIARYKARAVEDAGVVPVAETEAQADSIRVEEGGTSGTIPAELIGAYRASHDAQLP